MSNQLPKTGNEIDDLLNVLKTMIKSHNEFFHDVMELVKTRSMEGSSLVPSRDLVEIAQKHLNTLRELKDDPQV